MNQAPGSRSSAPCFHGGAFFEAVGPRFDDLSRSGRVVNADVLDAWFPPAPRALQALRDHLPWLIRTSPPTDCGGFLEVVAETRGVPVECLLPGGGSSDLMFLALPRWLDAGSRVTLLDPTYGEYRHILDHVVGCQVDALPLRREDGYRVDLDALAASAADSDLLILVNPNSPTGLHVPREQQLQLLAAQQQQQANRQQAQQQVQQELAQQQAQQQQAAQAQALAAQLFAAQQQAQAQATQPGGGLASALNPAALASLAAGQVSLPGEWKKNYVHILCFMIYGVF